MDELKSKTQHFIECMRRAAQGKELPPSSGAWYCICTPAGWELFLYRETDLGYLDHVVFWEYAAVYLGELWQQVLGQAPDLIASLLMPHPYAFARGRVTWDSRKKAARAFWGEELVYNPKPGVERLLGITGMTKWLTDEHEQRQEYDQLAVAKVLGGEVLG